MKLSRRAFIGNATAFALLHEGLAAATGSAVLEKSGRASDNILCRRVYLDAAGRIPTRTEAEAFVNDKDSRKYEKLIDKLLDSDDYADYWAMRMCDCLRVKSEFPINLWPNAVYVYHRRIREAVASDEPWPDFARALLCGRGSNFRVPESNFLRAVSRRSPEGVSEAASVTFLMEPSEKYAKYFSRVAWKSTKEWKEEIVYLKDGPADLVPEAFLDELQGPLASKFESTPPRRAYYWIFNKMPTSSTISEWTRIYRSAGYRMKPLLKQVFLSSAYRAGPIRGKFPARRMDAEVLDDALCSITGSRRAFESIAPEPFSYLPPKRKSVLVEDGSITSAFLLLFGRPARDTGMLEERRNEITPKQRLYLYNSGKLWRDVSAMVSESSFASLDRRGQINELYWRFLARPVGKEELTFLDQTKTSINNVAWHLINSREFLYRL